MKIQHGDVFVSANRRDFYVSVKTVQPKTCSECGSQPSVNPGEARGVVYVRIALRDSSGRALPSGFLLDDGKAQVIGYACCLDCAEKIAEAHEAKTDEEYNDETE